MPGTQAWRLYEVEHRQRYEFFAGRCRGLRVLDAACGVGYGSRILADSAVASVLGVDISSEAISFARDQFAHPAVEYLQGDVRKLTAIQRDFDAVVSFETIEHLADPEDLIREAQSVLVPGGLFICSTPNRDFSGKGNGQNPYHLCEWSYGEFASSFSRWFDIDEQYHQSPAPGYVRYLELLAEFERLQKQVRFSRLLRFEAFARRVLGKTRMDVQPLPEILRRITPGDFDLQPLRKPGPEHLSFILVGRSRKAKL
jgi:SAM-dependent methyltransferase